MSVELGEHEVVHEQKISVLDLVDLLNRCPEKVVLEAIKQLDRDRQDMDFTRALRDYFAGEVENEENAAALQELVEPKGDHTRCDTRWGCEKSDCPYGLASFRPKDVKLAARNNAVGSKKLAPASP